MMIVEENIGANEGSMCDQFENCSSQNALLQAISSFVLAIFVHVPLQFSQLFALKTISEIFSAIWTSKACQQQSLHIFMIPCPWCVAV